MYEPGNMGRMAWLPPALLVLLLVLALSGGYYGWHRFEVSRAWGALEEEDYGKVIRHSDRLIAFGYDRDRARWFRAMALAEVDAEQAMAELRAIADAEGGEFDPAASLRLAELMLADNRFDELGDFLDQFPDSSRPNARYLILRAKLQMAEGDYSGAYRTVRGLLLLDPDHPEGNLAQALLLVNAEGPVNGVQAKVSLRRAARSDSEDGLDALILLATDSRLPVFPEDRQWLAGRLREHPGASSRARIIAATQDLLVGSEPSEVIVRRTIAQEGAPAPELVANWLLQIGDSAALIGFLTTGDGLDLPLEPRSNLLLQAYLRQDDFAAVRELLLDAEEVFPDPLRTSLIAYADAVLTPDAGAGPTSEWRRAVTLMRDQGDVEGAFALANLAKERGWLDDAREAYEWSLGATEDPAQTLAILRQLAVVFDLRKDAEGLLGVNRRIARLDPDDDGARKNVYYLETLLDGAPNAPPERFENLVERHPGSPVHSGYAFALWKDGEFERASEQFRLLDERFLEASGSRLVGALVALDNRDWAGARQLFAGIDPEDLLPEEARLFEELSSRLERSPDP